MPKRLPLPPNFRHKAVVDFLLIVNWRKQIQVVESQNMGQLLKAKKGKIQKTEQVSKRIPNVKCACAINQSMLPAYENVPNRKYSGVESYQDPCLPIRSWKIQRKLEFDYFVEIQLENTTGSIERWKFEIQPFPLPTDRCKCQNFHNLVIKILPYDQRRFTLLLPIICPIKHPIIHSYFHN